MKFIRLLLIPFTPVYRMAIYFRNLFFDKGIFKPVKVNVPVISVGNITVGGSGKTPLVIYLIDLLKRSGLNPGVLSRGYGRKTKGYVLVSRNGELEKSVNEYGDEIYQTVLECKVPAAVSENRVKGAGKLIADTGINTIVLDDAFQHRWIYRDMNILIFEQRFLVHSTVPENFLLPAGYLREPYSAIERADAILINRKFSEAQEIPQEISRYFEGKKVFTAHYKSINFVDLTTRTEHAVEEFSGQKSLVVSGIANPFSFFNVLRQTGVDTENRMIFGDHKNYSHKEVQAIRKKYYATNSHSVVTTEKDAVKLLKYSDELDDIDIFYLRIKIEPDNREEFNNYILNGLDKIKPVADRI
jgi:tetraacyldisaccharide 4'-kinase